MSVVQVELAPREVLGSYPAACSGGTRMALGNAGGFSGARLWKVQGSAGLFCLRAWPPGNPSVERLQGIHQLMKLAAAAGLSFIPAVIPSHPGVTWREHAGRFWELTTWMPGKADFHAHPSPARL